MILAWSPLVRVLNLDKNRAAGLRRRKGVIANRRTLGIEPGVSALVLIAKHSQSSNACTDNPDDRRDDPDPFHPFNCILLFTLRFFRPRCQ